MLKKIALISFDRGNVALINSFDIPDYCATGENDWLPQLIQQWTTK